MFSRRSTLALFVMMLLIPISSGTATAEGMDDVSHFPPEPEGEWYILDAADVISNETEAEWDADLRAAHEESGRLVRLVTIPSMCAFDTYTEEYGDMRCVRWTGPSTNVTTSVMKRPLRTRIPTPLGCSGPTGWGTLKSRAC